MPFLRKFSAFLKIKSQTSVSLIDGATKTKNVIICIGVNFDTKAIIRWVVMPTSDSTGTHGPNLNSLNVSLSYSDVRTKSRGGQLN